MPIATMAMPAPLISAIRAFRPVHAYGLLTSAMMAMPARMIFATRYREPAPTRLLIAPVGQSASLTYVLAEFAAFQPILACPAMTLIPLPMAPSATTTEIAWFRNHALTALPVMMATVAQPLICARAVFALALPHHVMTEMLAPKMTPASAMCARDYPLTVQTVIPAPLILAITAVASTLEYLRAARLTTIPAMTAIPVR